MSDGIDSHDDGFQKNVHGDNTIIIVCGDEAQLVKGIEGLLEILKNLKEKAKRET